MGGLFGAKRAECAGREVMFSFREVSDEAINDDSWVCDVCVWMFAR